MKRCLFLALLAFVALIPSACTEQGNPGVSGVPSGAGITNRPQYVYPTKRLAEGTNSHIHWGEDEFPPGDEPPSEKPSSKAAPVKN